MKKEKIILFFTGGTISMKEDEENKTVIPALTDNEILSKATGLEDKANIETYHYGSFPGPHIGPEVMLDIGNKVEEITKREDVKGVVITHGTDTLEETAFFLDLFLKTRKPVVVTGAMRNSSELGYDGPSNLSASVCVVDDDDSEGVLVVMNNHIYTPDEVTKVHTLSVDTFRSMEFGPLGIVDQDKVIYYRNRKKVTKINTKTIENKVGLIKTVAGMDGSYLEFFIQEGYRGIVIEGMGRGNVPPSIVDSIKKAIINNIHVVLVSRCTSGRVLDSYGYNGGGAMLREMGVILGGSLSGQKARIKLMLTLGKTNNTDEIRKIFEKDLYGIK